MGIFKRGTTDDKIGQWNGNTATGNSANPTTAAELRMRRPANEGDRRPANEGENLGHSLGTLMERVSLSSVQEIDRLIAELQSLKLGLQHEADRVQREVVGFATMSQSAMQSTKIIAESLTHWRNVPEAPSVSDGASARRGRPRREPLLSSPPEHPADEEPPSPPLAG
jgi:hypothetical protein